MTLINSNKFFKICLILHFGIPLWALPITTTEPAIHFNFVPNDGDKFSFTKKTKETLAESLQVFDHLILDDSGSLVFGSNPGDGISVPEVLPTSEDLAPGQLNSGKVEFEEITSINREDGHLGNIPEAEILQVRQRLQKLDFYFEFLRVMSEDCRQRMLCEVMREPGRFYPLSSVLEDATSLSDNYQYLTSQLVNTVDGARLLSYLEASFKGQDRTRSCAVFQYRCPSKTEQMINYEALCLWREMVRWLTIHVIAKVQ